MDNFSCIGTGVAIITPFTPDETVDYPALRRLIGHIIDGGTDYIVVLGTTGETPTLTPPEKEEILRTAVTCAAGRVGIVAGVGGNCTRTIVEQLADGNFEGVDAILSVVPYYNKPTQEGLYRHYSAIAEASPRPVILYNIPSRTGVNIAVDTVLRLANEQPNIVAIKEASANIDQISELIRRCPDRFEVVSGDDGLTVPLIALGAKGVISVAGNAVPAHISRMVKLALSGDVTGANTIQHQLKELITMLFADGNPAGIKALLHTMGIVHNQLRLPLVPACTETARQLETIYNRLPTLP